MTDQVWFPKRWPPIMEDEIQLYSMATPNGQKIGICLEEMELSHDAHLINITTGDQHDEEYLKLSPNGKIPSILDPNGPEGEPIIIHESIAILIYLADKTGLLLPQNYISRMEHIQWLLFQASHIGPMFGQFGHFHMLNKGQSTDTYTINRYLAETKRLLKVLDDRLQGRNYIVNNYSIVDIAIAPWVDCLDGFYKAGEVLEMSQFKNVLSWRERVTSRPAYIKGKRICAIES